MSASESLLCDLIITGRRGWVLNYIFTGKVQGTFNPSSFWGILVIHLLALMAPFTFTWAGVFAFMLMVFITAPLGTTMGFHRLLAHGSFEASKPLRYFLTFCGCLALQDGPIQWVATHRLHHKETEQTNDPHSPAQSFLWAHLVWNFYKHPLLKDLESLRQYAPELCRDPVFHFFNRYYAVIYAILAVLVLGGGSLFGGWKLGLSLFVWGFALRTVYTWHTTWLVNSVCHLWGYQTYQVPNNSRNNWWVALLTFGEGWHNNHHAQPRSARMGLVWYELDMTYWLINLLHHLGLVKKVMSPHLSVFKSGST